MKFRRRSGAGFTLVELIIVIVILGILAAVAVPAYSGYVKKAGEAADNTLLGAVNDAFAAACADHGISSYDIVSAKLTAGGTDNKCIVTVEQVMANAGVTPIRADSGAFGFVPLSAGTGTTDITAVIKPSFDKFFEGNAATPLKAFAPGEATFANGVFAFPNSPGAVSIVTKDWGDTGYSLNFSTDDVENVKKSTFTQSEDLGVNTLLTQVDGISNLVANLLGNPGLGATIQELIVGDEDFQSFLAEKTGVDLNDTEALQKVMENLPEGTNPKKLLTNAFVLYAAANSDTLQTEEFIHQLAEQGGEVDVSLVGSVLNGDKKGSMGDAISQLACTFGMNMAYDAYMKSENVDSDITDFASYITSDQGAADLAGYVSCMNLITGNLDNPEKAMELLVTGFNGKDLIDAISSALK